MTHVILIRHSETKQVPGVSSHEWMLTEEGRARCLTLARLLEHYPIARIATSDEPKAHATASLLAGSLKILVPLLVDPDLRETRRETAPFYDDIEAFRSAIREAMLNPNRLVFGEESFTEARLRLTHALHRLITAYPNDTLAVVTHGTIMSLVLGHSSGVDSYATWRSLDMPAYAVLTPNLDMLDLRTSVIQGSR